MQEKLDLSNCKTNKEVCELVSARVRSVNFETFLAAVQSSFVYQREAAIAIYTGLLHNKNVLLSGKGGYGKSNLIRFTLDYFGIPYTVVPGYKDMPVDALLGLPDMKKLLEDSSYMIRFEESVFYKPGVLVGEEFTDILPSTAAALKEILTSKGFHTKNGKIESLISTMIVAGNRAAADIADDDSKKAFYLERFPIQTRVEWQSHTKEDYMKFLKLKFPSTDVKALSFLSYLFEYNHMECNNTISPRVAQDIADVYLRDGIEFISNFSIDLSNIQAIRDKSKEEILLATAKEAFKTVKDLIDSQNSIEKKVCLAVLAKKAIVDLKVGNNSNALTINRFIVELNSLIDSYCNQTTPDIVAIVQAINSISRDEN
jgi:MoxR-like ATPase